MDGLTQAHRDQARARAEQSIRKRNGPKPERTHYADYTESRYPAAFSRAFGLGLVLAALAAGAISGIRLYFAGRDFAAHTIEQPALTWVIGGSTVIAAELLVILATVAGQIFLFSGGRQKRLLAWIPVVVGMVVAFVGNWTITQPSTAWGWVETVFPPITVLSVAGFFELALMPELERRQANANAYQAAFDDWQQIDRDPTRHANWTRVFATTLRDELMRVNALGVDDLTPEEWRTAVQRELRAEDWWDAGEFSLNSRNSLHSGQTKMEVALQFLRDNPDVFAGLQDQTLLQSEVAYRAGVSQSTISRAKEQLSKNGHAV